MNDDGHENGAHSLLRIRALLGGVHGFALTYDKSPLAVVLFSHKFLAFMHLMLVLRFRDDFTYGVGRGH